MFAPRPCSSDRSRADAVVWQASAPPKERIQRLRAALQQMESGPVVPVSDDLLDAGSFGSDSDGEVRQLTDRGTRTVRQSPLTIFPFLAICLSPSFLGLLV
jgi:hypothetical protein